MKKKFIGYFDLLGFQDFIFNNDEDEQKSVIHDNIRELGNALSRNKLKEVSIGYIPDLSCSNMNSINFSDTIVIWSNDDTFAALQEIIEVSFLFNSRMNLHFFPLRGAIVRGQIYDLQENVHSLNVSSVYGRGLINSYKIAENLEWAGTIVDEELVSIIKKNKKEEILNKYCKEYNIPCKEGILKQGYAMKLIISDTAFDSSNYANMIRKNFSQYRKKSNSTSVQKKLKNTLSFLTVCSS